MALRSALHPLPWPRSHWSPWAWRAGCVSRRPAPGLSGWLLLWSVGVRCGCFLCAVFPVSGGLSRRCRGSSGRALVASAGWVGVVVWRSALAVAGVSAVVFRRGGGRRLPVGLGGGAVRGGLVGLGSGSRWPFGGSRVRSSVSPCRWPCRPRCGWRRLRRFPLPWRGRGPLSGGGFCCAGVAGAPALWRVCRLQRQFSHWQLKPWSCRCSHWDEIHQQRVIVQGGRFGFGPFVPAPAPIKHL